MPSVLFQRCPLTCALASTVPVMSGTATEESSNRLSKIQPVVWQVRGRWLAVSAPGSALKIGVFGDSKVHAMENFHNSLNRWAAWKTENAR